jgi:NADPH:quinone reductase-like Zn-dependent oxidoreductase
VCASEVDQWLGKASRYPAEIGHEVAGVVEDVAQGEEGSLKPGDSVVSWVPGGGRTSGTIAIVGYHQGGQRALDLGHWNERALRIVNAHFRTMETIPRQRWRIFR